MQLSRKDLQPYIGAASKVSEVLSRKRPLSLQMMRRLHKGLGLSAEVLLGDDAAIGGDEALAVLAKEPGLDYSRFPLKEMWARGCFAAGVEGSAQTLKSYAEELLRPWLAHASCASLRPALLRAPQVQGSAKAVDDMALLAWQMCVLRKASDQRHRVSDYQTGCVTPAWLQDLARLSAFDQGPRLAQEHLARYGICLVIERHFKKTFLDGAAMLSADGMPIVALTLRRDRLDSFWFALLHELAHVGLHLSAEQTLILDDLDSPRRSRIEQEADAWAGEALLPAQSWKASLVRKSRGAADALALAQQLGRHPAIVAGRVRHEAKDFRLLAGLMARSPKPSEQLGLA